MVLGIGGPGFCVPWLNEHKLSWPRLIEPGLIEIRLIEPRLIGSRFSGPRFGEPRLRGSQDEWARNE